MRRKRGIRGNGHVRGAIAASLLEWTTNCASRLVSSRVFIIVLIKVQKIRYRSRSCDKLRSDLKHR